MLKRIKQIPAKDFPGQLRELPQPPKELFFIGQMPNPENKLLCVVGSRRYTQYGSEACKKIISGLAGYPITIVSGLALGIDSIAHKAALDAGLQTVAVPGSGLDPSVLYPRSHVRLAEKIIESGGGLMSEFKSMQKAAPWTFPQRNRIMAGLSDAILVIEAEEKSGTLITSRLATEYNKDVFAVPGSIFSPQSNGPHMLLRLGATPTTSSQDIIEHFGWDPTDTPGIGYLENLSKNEKIIFDLIAEPISQGDLIRLSPLSTSETQAIIISLELSGLIIERIGKISRV
jgi:DNA processing protein